MIRVAISKTHAVTIMIHVIRSAETHARQSAQKELVIRHAEDILAMWTVPARPANPNVEGIRARLTARISLAILNAVVTHAAPHVGGHVMMIARNLRATHSAVVIHVPLNAIRIHAILVAAVIPVPLSAEGLAARSARPHLAILTAGLIHAPKNVEVLAARTVHSRNVTQTAEPIPARWSVEEIPFATRSAEGAPAPRRV